MIEDEIPAALDKERLDRVVALLADVTRATAANLVAEGHVQLDGESATSGKARVRAGQRVTVDTSSVPVVELPGPDAAVEVTVVHEDDDVIVVDKPAGLVVHPGAGRKGGTLVNGLLARYPELAAVGDPARPGIVHRLDAGTSGLLVVARTESAYERLVAALSAREVERVYLTLVSGLPSSDTGVIDAPVGRDTRDPTRMAVVTDGRPARTRFEVVQRFTNPQTSLLRCRLESGRTHQIRVHLASIGHPVVGDPTYRGRKGGAPSPLSIGRPFLHATELSFHHPRTGEEVRTHSPLPPDLQAVLDGLSGSDQG